MMPTVVVELTNRCNLACTHCFAGRHGGREDLPPALFDKVLADARTLGFGQLSFTGGDPTVYPHFERVLGATDAAGYDFRFVTNGWNFTTIYPMILQFRRHLRGIIFSLDGAREATHNRLRGAGSYRRVMQAVSICVVEEIPFGINMVVTAHNCHEIQEMAELAHRLGSRALNLAHLMPSPLTSAQGFDLGPDERKQVEAEIEALQGSAPLPIESAAGFHTRSLFSCDPLNLQQISVDRYGNVTTCCNLSGQASDGAGGDVLGNLAEMSLAEAYGRLVAENERFRRAKSAYFAAGSAVDSDYFPCWYCALAYRKVEWLRAMPENPWGRLLGERPSGGYPRPSLAPSMSGRVRDDRLIPLIRRVQ
ncbi:MAG: radical SAM protein [Chloroflexi bacterium]|nr:radical SAM protein [Chloroflexota bacterium]